MDENKQKATNEEITDEKRYENSRKMEEKRFKQKSKMPLIFVSNE